jgi:hypothetical protein
MDMNQTATQLLDALARNTEPPGGLAFAKALQQARLDYSAESVERVDALLDQIRQKLKPEIGAFGADPARMNFARLLCFYLGELIARQAGTAIRWYGYEEAVQRLPSDFGLPAEFFSRVVGISAADSGGMVCLPLGAIGERLFDEPPGRSCREYVAETAERLKGNQRKKDENEWSQLYLERFFAGKDIPGGLAFRANLEKLGLDYSVESLGRIDGLLGAIRRELRPDYAQFVNHGESGNFLLLLGYYLGATVARSGGLSLKWLGAAETRAVIGDQGEHFETSRGCRLGPMLTLPLSVLNEILFDPQPSGRSCLSWGREILAEARGGAQPVPALVSIKRSGLPATGPAKGRSVLGGLLGNKRGNPHWEQAMQAAGFLAAHGMYMVEDGSPLRPTLLIRKTFVVLADESVEQAIRVGKERMLENPENAPFMVFAHDAYANLPSGRTDALMLEVRSYQNEELHAELVLPYRNAAQPGGFAIYSPKLLHCSVAAGRQPELFAGFYAGVDGYKSTTFSWNRYLDESI